MIDLKCAIRHLDSIVFDTKRAYYDAVYAASRAVLEPVVVAFSDVLQESVKHAVKEGVKDAFRPADRFGVLFGRRNK